MATGKFSRIYPDVGVTPGPDDAFVAYIPGDFPKKVGGVLQTVDTVLAHELLGHAYIKIFGMIVDVGMVPEGARPKKIGAIPWAGGTAEGEAEGMWGENEYRMERGLQLRQYYRTPGDWVPPPDIRRAIDLEEERRRLEQQRWWREFWLLYLQGQGA